MNAKQLQAVKENIQGDNSLPIIRALSALEMEKRILWILTEQDPDVGIDTGAIDHQCSRVDEAIEKLADEIFAVVL